MTIKNDDFVHLHNHTDFSMLDGAAQVDDLVRKVRTLGQKAVAVTDHGVLHGTYDLWKACNSKFSGCPDCTKVACPKHKLKAIIGVEAYVTPRTSRFDDTRVFFGGPYGTSDSDKARRRNDVSAGGTYTHMTIWAENNQGMHNLNWMQSIASKDRVIGKWARLDRQLLSEYSAGLIATTGCPSGAVQTYLRLGMYKDAVREASELQDIFGKDNFFVEVMDHNINFERSTRSDLLKIAKEIGAPLVATNDLHYVDEKDAIRQDALLCINSGSNLDDPGRFKFDGSGYYVKTAEQMHELFDDIPESISNTLLIAERCNVSFEPEIGRFMPHVPIPDGKTEEEYFHEQVMQGLNERFPDGLNDNYKAQAEFELDTILKMGFPSYFLVVADFVKWAKNNNIFVGPGRGSAAGSIVSYALRITDLDPIEHKLVFERFLNPERISLPDIDIDFEEGGREQVIEYCSRRYGVDNVAQIITFGKILSKQALRDSARIMGYDYQTGDVLSKSYPEPVAGKNGSIDDFLNNKDYSRHTEGEQFREVVNSSADYKKVTSMAEKIEGLIRNTGVHASGVLISNTPIADVCPTWRRQDDNAIITQFEAHGCEDLGFVKMDFLGLKNLNTNKSCLKNIVQRGKDAVDLTKIPLDDSKTFELIGNGDTLGVFQLDGDGMRTLLKRMKPTVFNDISATIALYRPGPMGVNAHNDYADRKNGRKQIKPIHPEVDDALKEILDDTYGLVVFQEQIQLAARKLANYTMGQADLLRRAMGKKIKSELDAQYDTFESGMIQNGYSKAAVKAVWDVFEPFADYAFNRAHTACYGMNAYYNAYLKANYPVEYMAALLTTNENNHAKLGLYLAECARMNIKVDVPDVNASYVDFAPSGDSNILFGLGAVRNVGEAVALEIIKAREEKGEFTSFLDFIKKVPESVCNKRKIESLIKAGAFDKFEHSRRALLAIHVDAVDAAMPVKRKESEGQFDLFETMNFTTPKNEDETFSLKIPDIEEFDKRQKLNFEREMLGLFVSDHPLASLSGVLSRNSSFPLIALTDPEKMREYAGSANSTVDICAMVTAISRRVAKKSGNQYAYITLEDLSAGAEVGLFGKNYEAQIEQLAIDQIVHAKCRIRVEEDGSASLSINELQQLNVSLDDTIKDIHIELPAAQCTPKNIELFKEIIKRHPGNTKVVIEGKVGNKVQLFALPAELGINESAAFYSEIKALFDARLK
ncbi:MAG: DNA polymerase III subunit alpha [Candidatus Ancillula sp.]|nr:DNA polymerase III subunit alpha [Candidatus Ancillula sp.]